MAEISSASWSETAASNNSSPPDGAPENTMKPSEVNDWMRETMAQIKRWYNRLMRTATTGGTADAFTVTYTQAQAAYVTGYRYAVKFHTAANASATININSLGAKSIYRPDGSAIAAGDIITDQSVELVYDGTNMVMLSPPGFRLQPYDADLAALASVTSAADKVPYFTGSGTASVTDLSSFARTLLDDTTAAAARATLGVSATGTAFLPNLVGNGIWCTASGTDTITLTSAQTATAYANGTLVAFVAAGTNTGAVTVNLDTLGAKSLKNVSGSALSAGNITSGDLVIAQYDGTDFRLIFAIVPAASETVAGKVELATTAEAQTGTDTARAVTPAGLLAACAFLANNNTFTKAQRGSITTLTDGATITPDFSANNDFTVTLGGNRTLANPTNITAGQSGVLYITQDGTGSRVLSWGSYWDFQGGTAPTLSTAAGAVDVIAYTVRSATSICATLAVKGAA